MANISIKMRASRQGRHISGAERIVAARDIPDAVKNLTDRALHHSLGEPDFINLKMEAETGKTILRLPALAVSSRPAATVAESLSIMRELLAEVGGAADELVNLLQTVRPMRGAVLYDVATGKRLEPDPARGIRVTYMDATAARSGGGKNHFQEALVLATKVANAPGMVAEVCISDDPDYVTGYFASKQHGYVRLSPLKEKGSSRGGRIFICDTRLAAAAEIINYLENQWVLVENLPPSPTKPLPPARRLADELARLEKNHLYRRMKVIETPQDTAVTVGGKNQLLLASNNYLNMATEPRVCRAAADAALYWGAGSGGSRLTTGNTSLHEELEAALARFKHREAACLFNTGYTANVGIISALLDENSIVFSDEYNHASIIDGCRLSRAKIVVYRHNDMADLEKKIKAYPAANGLIVSDAVFSMDGDIVNLPELVKLGKKYALITMIDEAHATGVIGATGRGTEEYFGGTYRPDILMGTLSKAFGAEGGFACASREIIEFLRNKARSFIFSTSQAPATLAAALEAIRIIEAEPRHVQNLQSNVKFFCRELKRRGIDIDAETPIIPIVIGDEARAMNIAAYLAERGLMVPAIRYPTVAAGTARLRVALMANHTETELFFAARLIAEAMEKITE